MIRSGLCNKTSCDIVKSCLCRVDRETAARDVIKLLLTEPNDAGIRRIDNKRKLGLPYDINLYQSPATESFLIYHCQGNELLHQIGIDIVRQSCNQQRRNYVINANRPTAVQLSVVLLRLREQVSMFCEMFCFKLMLL